MAPDCSCVRFTMVLDSVGRYLEDKSILITGATGFVAKLFVEKVLRTQPNVKKLFLLVRASDARAAKQRLEDEIKQTDLFKVLKEKHDECFESFFWNKVSQVADDISLENLGITDIKVRDVIQREVDIIINTAGETNFNERYDVAFSINTIGVKNILGFAMKCLKLEVLLHVSTAFVAKKLQGVILEGQVQVSDGFLKFDIDNEVNLLEKKLMELERKGASNDTIKAFMKATGSERANLFGWPNVYTFTKAMGETLLYGMSRDLPIVILRPTIITSTYKEPFPGWIQGVRTIDILAVGYGMGQVSYFPASLSASLDMVPVDMVVNAMLVTMVVQSGHNSMSIYHVGSSARNPLKINRLSDISYRYFSINPCTKKDGSPIQVRKCSIISFITFRIYMAIRYKLPLQVLRACSLLCFGDLRNQYDCLIRKYNRATRVAKAFRPFVSFHGSFDDQNSQKLIAAMGEKEKEEFGFDTACINWDHYWMEVHLPGLIKHAMDKK